MRAAFERRPMWDTYYDNMSFEQAYLQVRKSVGKCGFFHYKGLPYCTFSKSEWDSFSHEERIVATKAAEQRYYARSLVKSFFMRYGEITSYREVYFTNEEGVFASYQVSALQNDKKRTAFDLDTFVIDLQRPRFKYYSTMRERNPDPRDYKGHMERGANAECYLKWINCSDRSFDDISVLVLELQKTLNPKLMATANSICMKQGQTFPKGLIKALWVKSVHDENSFPKPPTFIQPSNNRSVDLLTYCFTYIEFRNLCKPACKPD